jgi:hypothetical protein
MESHLIDAARRSISYRKQILERHVAPSTEAIQNLSQFNFPLPDNSTSDEKVIEINVQPYTNVSCACFLIKNSLLHNLYK